MSNIEALQSTEDALPPVGVASIGDEPLIESLEDVLDRVRETIAPVWPLKDYVAVNPYCGLAERPFLNARHFMQAFSDCELLMPLEYFAEQYFRGRFGPGDIQAALDEQARDTLDPVLPESIHEIVTRLANVARKAQESSRGADGPKPSRRVRLLSEAIDRYTGSQWTAVIREEIAKHCAAHYDEGQAMWRSPWKHLPLYQAWRSAAQYDRNVELLGITGFRSFVSRLPCVPEAAIVCCLRALRVPEDLWELLLLCQAFSIPGWSAWTKYQFELGRRSGEENQDFVGLLAIRLAYDVALAEVSDFHVSWESAVPPGRPSHGSLSGAPGDDATLRYTLLRASEIGYRRELVSALSQSRCMPQTDSAAFGPSDGKPPRKRAQVVCCIDVRSERMRRHLESLSGEIETFGFAGFFGVPMEYVALGENRGTSQVPALLSPQFKVREELRPADPSITASVLQRRSAIRALRKAWKNFQNSAVSCFACVEATGLLYGPALLGRTHARPRMAFEPRFDGIAKRDRMRLGPMLGGLNRQGMTTSAQADLAEKILRGIGLSQDFARLVVFCGHGSETANNPLQAGLDCGACGGHSGEPNARFAAMLLNQSYIRNALAERGIEIPRDTLFIAGLHNTTTDSVELADLSEVPSTHAEDLEELARHLAEAGLRTRTERLPVVSSDTIADLLRRSRDWSETRPEWGLAGNAAFIAAPRSLTRSLDLGGQAFLHSYDHSQDPDGTLLEQIMTAPLIVAHWINMQYYASTVDPQHFGSGTKTLHNVVGRFGIFSGNGGDLMTGLPWESVHTGRGYQHHPQRLLAVIAAPRAVIERVIGKHPLVETLLANEWLQLVAVEEESLYSYASGHSWRPLHTGEQQLS